MERKTLIKREGVLFWSDECKHGQNLLFFTEIQFFCAFAPTAPNIASPVTNRKCVFWSLSTLLLERVTMLLMLAALRASGFSMHFRTAGTSVKIVAFCKNILSPDHDLRIT
jgi:hypothetical protein